MDKGYDSEEIHELIRDTLNACSLIPVRDRKRKRISGYYRRRTAQAFDEDKYHQRNKIETVFSVLKRRFGEALKARKYLLQIKEIKIKVILYRLSEMISTSLIKLTRIPGCAMQTLASHDKTKVPVFDVMNTSAMLAPIQNRRLRRIGILRKPLFI